MGDGNKGALANEGSNSPMAEPKSVVGLSVALANSIKNWNKLAIRTPSNLSTNVILSKSRRICRSITGTLIIIIRGTMNRISSVVVVLSEKFKLMPSASFQC